MIDKGLVRARLTVIRDTLDMHLSSKGYERIHIQELMDFVESREKFIEGTKLAITKFEELIDHWRRTCDNQAKSIIENGVTLTSKQYLIDLYSKDLIQAKETENALRITLKDLREDEEASAEIIDNQSKIIARYEQAMEKIDVALEEAATDEIEGEDPAVPTREAANFAGSWGISADGGGCRCSICNRGRWAKR